MSHLLRILTLHSLKDLLKYKSFFLLILFLFFLDRMLHIDASISESFTSRYDLTTSATKLAAYVFTTFPKDLLTAVCQWQSIVVLAALFFFKQLISLWPSSDMRRMHRNERHRFGVLQALVSLRWHQIAWDALAVSMLCGTVGGWTLVWFFLLRTAWHREPSPVWLWVLGLAVFMATPVALAGFSYSSKLAILSRGGFMGKFKLFVKLFINRHVLFYSWVFYFVRQVVELIFVVLLPATILLTIPHPLLRIVLAGLLAAPVYSFIKMASFKFFLYVYQPYAEVRHEYADYYQGLDDADSR